MLKGLLVSRVRGVNYVAYVGKDGVVKEFPSGEGVEKVVQLPEGSLPAQDLTKLMNHLGVL